MVRGTQMLVQSLVTHLGFPLVSWSLVYRAAPEESTSTLLPLIVCTATVEALAVACPWWAGGALPVAAPPPQAAANPRTPSPAAIERPLRIVVRFMVDCPSVEPVGG